MGGLRPPTGVDTMDVCPGGFGETRWCQVGTARADRSDGRMRLVLARTVPAAACAWCWQGLCPARTALTFARGIQRAVESDFGSGSQPVVDVGHENVCFRE
jgi:hypothetical protein